MTTLDMHRSGQNLIRLKSLAYTMDSVSANLLLQLDAISEAKSRGAGRAELKSLLSQAALGLIKLRQAARRQVEEVEAHKTETLRSKADVEASNLALQNLLYEQNYYAKEIASCRSFRQAHVKGRRN